MIDEIVRCTWCKNTSSRFIGTTCLDFNEGGDTESVKVYKCNMCNHVELFEKGGW
ncbi:MAG: hypothetical protein R3321_00510 [Nitrososphaeraceae archaeon]|nr:hypothetical protein [Nitrososphaeraceae archaeon]